MKVCSQDAQDLWAHTMDLPEVIRALQDPATRYTSKVCLQRRGPAQLRQHALRNREALPGSFRQLQLGTQVQH